MLNASFTVILGMDLDYRRARVDSIDFQQEFSEGPVCQAGRNNFDPFVSPCQWTINWTRETFSRFNMGIISQDIAHR